MSESSREADRPLDLGELIAALARHGVDYLVIGGVATQVHGHRRTTMDLDVTPDPSPDNLRRLGAALDDLIRMKRAAERPGDLDDIAVLAEIERQGRQPKP